MRSVSLGLCCLVTQFDCHPSLVVQDYAEVALNFGNKTIYFKLNNQKYKVCVNSRVCVQRCKDAFAGCDVDISFRLLMLTH